MTNTMNNNEQTVQGQIAPGTGPLVIPDLVWAAVIFAALNILLVLWFAMSPKLSLGMERTPREERVAIADKPSPFTPVVDERRVPRKQAEKVRPVVVATLESLDNNMSGVQPASWTTRTAQQPTDSTYVRGNAVYELMDRQTEMPRLTAANYPRRTEPAVRHVGSQPVIR